MNQILQITQLYLEIQIASLFQQSGAVATRMPVSPSGSRERESGPPSDVGDARSPQVHRGPH